MENAFQYVLIYCTVGSVEEAEKIGRAVVSEKLAACANVIANGLTSIYFWDGALQRDGETLLLLKSRLDLFPQLSQRIRSMHSYDTPCIVALPILTGDENYLAWLDKQLLKG